MKGPEQKALHRLEQMSDAELERHWKTFCAVFNGSKSARTHIRRVMQVATQRHLNFERDFSACEVKYNNKQLEES